MAGPAKYCGEPVGPGGPPCSQGSEADMGNEEAHNMQHGLMQGGARGSSVWEGEYAVQALNV